MSARYILGVWSGVIGIWFVVELIAAGYIGWAEIMVPIAGAALGAIMGAAHLGIRALIRRFKS